MLINFLVKFAKKKIDMKEVFFDVPLLVEWKNGLLAIVQNTYSLKIHLPIYSTLKLIELKIYVTSLLEPALLM